MLKYQTKSGVILTPRAHDDVIHIAEEEEGRVTSYSGHGERIFRVYYK